MHKVILMLVWPYCAGILAFNILYLWWRWERTRSTHVLAVKHLLDRNACLREKWSLGSVVGSPKFEAMFGQHNRQTDHPCWARCILPSSCVRGFRGEQLYFTTWLKQKGLRAVTVLHLGGFRISRNRATTPLR